MDEILVNCTLLTLPVQGRLEEELMTSRLKEVEGMAELKELRLKVMELETQTQVGGGSVLAGGGSVIGW